MLDPELFQGARLPRSRPPSLVTAPTRRPTPVTRKEKELC